MGKNLERIYLEICLIQEFFVIHNFTYPICIWTYFPLKASICIDITLLSTDNLGIQHKWLNHAHEISS